MDDADADAVAVGIDDRHAVLHRHDHRVDRSIGLGDRRRLVSLVALELGDLGHLAVPLD